MRDFNGLGKSADHAHDEVAKCPWQMLLERDNSIQEERTAGPSRDGNVAASEVLVRFLILGRVETRMISPVGRRSEEHSQLSIRGPKGTQFSNTKDKTQGQFTVMARSSMAVTQIIIKVTQTYTSQHDKFEHVQLRRSTLISINGIIKDRRGWRI